MQSTIVVCSGNFSLSGALYYLAHKKRFTNLSFAKILTTAKKSIAPRSISVAITQIRKGSVFVKRNGTIINTVPETKLQEGDEVVFWMPMDNIQYVVQNKALVFVK